MLWTKCIEAVNLIYWKDIRHTMIILPKTEYEVKNIDGIFPGEKGRATLESDLSVSPAPSGNIPFFFK